MIVFKISPTKKSLFWFKNRNIDLKAMSYATTLLFSKIIKKRKMVHKEIKIKITKNFDSSYKFYTNRLFISGFYSYDDYSRKEFVIEFFKNYLHELCHWYQSEILKVRATSLSYTNKDFILNNRKYRKNKWELHARKFEKENLVSFINFYAHYKINY
jgi:hypothetical protein